MIDDQTFDKTIRQPWRIDAANVRDFSADTDEEIWSARDPIPTEPGDLDEAKHETEGAAMFIGGLILTILAICAGLWASRTWGG